MRLRVGKLHTDLASAELCAGSPVGSEWIRACYLAALLFSSIWRMTAGKR